MEPMREYVHGHDDHNEELFEDFKQTHGKVYDNDLEHQSRLHVFRQNLRSVC
jgi:hypothetical protein